MSVWDIVGAGLNLVGGAVSAGASKKAAKAQKKAAQQSAAQFQPYTQLGAQAAGQLQGELKNNALLGDFTLADFQADPGYQFRLAEGEKGIDRAVGARGSRYSGATLKALQRYAQDFASNEFQRAYDRDSNNRTMRYNFLAGPTNMGMGASGTVGQYLGAAGDATASGRVGAANALTGGFLDAYNSVNPRYNNQPMVYFTGMPSYQR